VSTKDDEMREAVQEFHRAIDKVIVEPYLVPLLRWTDRQLRRWPWLYRKLS
jgi:hypothetical protein